MEVDGWRIGLGICKDTGVAHHVRATAALGAHAYAAGLVHLSAGPGPGDLARAGIAR